MSEQAESWRILIADDDDETRKILVAHIQALGHTVAAECVNGREAISQVAEVLPDLMMLDIKMPELDGIEVAKRAQAIHPCALVFVSGFVEDELIEGAGEAGAIGYVVKPFLKQQIQAAIQIAMKRFLDLQRAGSEVAELKTALETRKVLDRAKAFLMNTQGMSEEQAFKQIHFGARNSSRTMREVAEDILHEAGLNV